MKKKEIPLIDFSQIQNKYNIIEMKFPLPEISSIILNTKLEEFFEELTTLCKTSLLLFINKSNNDKISLENEITPQNQSKIKFDQKISNLPKSCLYTKLIEICLEIFNNDSNEKSQNENSRNYILKENPGLQLYILKFFQILFEISKDPIFSNKFFWKNLFNKYFLFYFNENFKSYEDVPQTFKILRNYLFYFAFSVSYKLVSFTPNQITQLINIAYNNKSNINLIYHIFSTIYEFFDLQKDLKPLQNLESKTFEKFCDLVFHLHQIHTKNWENSKEKFENKHQLWDFIKLRYLSLQIFSSFVFMIPEIFQNKFSNNYIINNSSTVATLLNLVNENQTKDFSFTLIHKLFSFVNKNNFKKFEVLSCAILTKILEIQQKIEVQVEKNEQVKENINSIREILQLLTDIISSYGLNLQKLFVEMEIYNFLKQVFGDPLLLSSLIKNILLLLLAIFKNCPVNIATFKKQFGFKKLRKYIMQINQDLIDSEVCEIILDIMVNNGKFDINKNFLIENEDSALFLLQLFSKSNQDIFCQILDIFFQICEQSILNRSACSSSGFISFLIKFITKISDSPKSMEIQEKIIRLIEIISSLRITTNELKLIFSHLKSLPGNFRPPRSSLILSIINKITQKTEQFPRSFFNFSGESSFLRLSSVPQSIFKRGYSFVTWFRLGDLFRTKHPQMDEIYKPRIFSFMSKEKEGFELFFNNIIYPTNDGSNEDEKSEVQFKLSFVIHLPSKNVIKAQKEIRLQIRKWYFIALTHKNKASSLGKFVIYINGKVAYSSHNIKYPSFSGLRYNHIGSDPFGKNCFCGQMSSIYLFNEELSKPQIEGIYSLSPNYFLSFSEAEWIINSSKIVSKEDFLDGSLQSKLFMSLRSQAVNKDQFIDKNERNNVKAQFINVSQGTTSIIHDVIYRSNGISVLFPLIIQSDQPLGSQQNIEIFKTQENYKNLIDYSIDPEISNQIFNIIKNVLIQSPANQQGMIRSHGFMILSHLYQHIHASHITENLIISIQEIITQINNPILIKDMIHNFPS
ncbi:beach domain-containing protein lvsc [Anaeramoeba ignava]|uniref:Beach domain-containing protein lvsc n=1 Tax=Anaeramoeba ignava TaxID=1746090 RepID=A0A9Q0LFF5_ANAIG|nr:beach domain-containing protein lvsc [Anaeramoeba ignava]